MATSALDVVNDALIRIGAETIPSFEDASATARATAQVYNTVRRRLLADHPWSFAVRSTIPTQLLLATVDRRLLHGRYAYQLPADLLRILGLESFGDFQVSGDQLYTDDLLTAVTTTNPRPPGLIYVSDAPPSFWAPWFDELIVLELAAAFAISITDQTARAETYKSMADRQARRARAIDSQTTPSIVFDLTRIYLARTPNPLAGA